MIRLHSFSIILLSASVLGTCDKSIRFEVPQPEEQKNEKEIPKKLMGSYSSLADSATLTITATQVTRRQEKDYVQLVSKLDAADRANLKGDTTFTMVDGGMNAKVVVRGDSVFAHVLHYDTIFSLQKGNLLRKVNNDYLLNSLDDEGKWKVMRLSTTGNGFTIGTVSDEEDIDNLKKLTNRSPSDTSRVFRPTRKQLELFLNQKGFNYEEIFVKLR